ncbi:CHAT domain-containing tetratricopeptide repeat protein [uncultured Aquimarina sp.]|uniref:CHAT domain-containing protein n=1 Tax=uncultured Aquimarina sp. TaxID=575652 RepID=UPI002631AC3A|nr:CHAT domain-containing tetratricopeptide repeat protein [uncultured Aquimarina sp.]
MNYINAQSVNDTILASQYYKNADSLLTNKKYNESVDFFQKALPIYEKAKAWEKVANCYNEISTIQWKKSSYKDSFNNAEKALEVITKNIEKESIQEAYAYDNIGTYYELSLYDYNTALFYYEKALAIKKRILPKLHLNISISHYYIGIVFFIKGEYNKSLEHHKKAVLIQLKAFGENHKKVGKTYNEIGRVYIRKKEYKKALEYFKQSLTISIEAFGSSNLEVATNLNNIGVALRGNKQYHEALIKYKKALQIYIKLYGDKHIRVSNSYYNIGLVHYDLKDYDKSLEFYNKALNIRLNELGENHQYVANSYLVIGLSFDGKKEYEKALTNYKKAININLNQSNINHTMVATIYNYIGNTLNKTKQFSEASSYYEHALKVNAISNSRNLHFFDSNIALETFLNKAKNFRHSYSNKKNIQSFENCIQVYQKADMLIESIRETLSNYQDRVTFANKVKEVYEGAIDAQLLLFKHTQDEDVLHQAFLYAEKSKANILKELLNQADAKNFAGLSTAFITLEKDLRIDHAFYQSQVIKQHSKQKLDSSKISKYESKLFEISRRKDSLTEVLEKKYPKYYELKYQNEVISAADIQQKLDNKTTFLEFFTADSITYAFTISKSKIGVKKLATLKLTENIEELRTSITDKNTASYKNNAFELYQQLISPIKDQIAGDDLIISPDGPLWHLNFDLLLTQHDASNNPKKLSYLLKDYTISYANSANLLFTPLKSNEKSNTLKECLAFSFSDSTNIVASKTLSMATLRDTGDDLPGTRREIKAIANIIDGNYFYGSEAIEANFKKNAGQYNILHLALHGKVDNERPENSKLFFTQSKDTVEDNLLYSHELFALDIPAELTVLSACNTGTGKIAKGEGIMSLGTAFQYAGTKSLLLSSWEVSDQTTPELMKYFYTNLKAGMNKAKALQQAKLQYLNNTNLNRTQPFYWGGFYLIGDTAPIEFSANYSLYWITGLVVFIILFLSIFWFRKRKASF